MLIEKFLPAARKRMCCINLDSTLMQAARQLEKDYEILIVCDAAGRMVGILTKTDAVRQFGTCSGASCTSPVSNAMVREVVTMTPDGRLKDAWDIMKVRGVKNIPVIDTDDKPVGVLNARDVLQNLWQEVQYEEDLLFNYVMNVGYR